MKNKKINYRFDFESYASENNFSHSNWLQTNLLKLKMKVDYITQNTKVKHDNVFYNDCNKILSIEFFA